MLRVQASVPVHPIPPRFARGNSLHSRSLALSPGLSSAHLCSCTDSPLNMYMDTQYARSVPGTGDHLCTAQKLPLTLKKGDGRLPSRGIKVGRGRQRELWGALQGDPTRRGFQEEVILELRLEGRVAMTRGTGRTGLGAERAFQAEGGSPEELENQNGAPKEEEVVGGGGGEG